ncbi:MAG TPA: methyltransferase domain-containing protein [Anaerolineales bacterium]
MDHNDHLNLLRKGITEPGGIWADIGSGRGAFTLALAELVGSSAEIYSIDKDRRALRDQARSIQARFPERPPGRTHYLVADFCQPLNLPALDGLVMANALHFIRDKNSVLQLLHGYLRPGGKFILVEYNIARGNPWVPHPIAYSNWEDLAARNGFVRTQLLAARPSRTFQEIYSALAIKANQAHS